MQKIEIPPHIIELARQDVRLHSLPDGSVPKELKRPEVVAFLENVGEMIHSLPLTSEQRMKLGFEAEITLYPGDYPEGSDHWTLGKNAALRKLMESIDVAQEIDD